jgi:hypothetical protein
MRRLRVLYAHPHLGHPGDVRDDVEDAQAYIDEGLAEWLDGPRAVPVETTEQAAAPEVTSARPTARRGNRPGRS